MRPPNGLVSLHDVAATGYCAAQQRLGPRVPACQPCHVWLLHIHKGGSLSAHRSPRLACKTRICKNNSGVNIAAAVPPQILQYCPNG